MEVPPIIPVPPGALVPWGSPDLSAEERADLAHAKALLEHPGFAIRMANLLGAPIEKGFAVLPEGWARQVHKASHAAMRKGLEWSVRTLRKKPGPASKKTHQLLVGGAFGLVALPIELPTSTMLMLRSIADIARSQGHDVRSIDTRLACLEVLALGGPKKSDDAAESSYWIVRGLLAKAISEAAAFVAEKGLIEESAPAIVRLLTSLSSRFGLVVSEEVAAKSIPVLGAASGAAINVMFMRHFQDMALGHFTVKRLEAKYGTASVQRIYGEIEPAR
jgi:hypothetical protein